MDGSSSAGADTKEEKALELMEAALAIVVTFKDSVAPVWLQKAIDSVMQSSGPTQAEGECWDSTNELPHLTERALYLHRQNGYSVDQIARRLGIGTEDATERLSIALHHVLPPSVGRA